MKYKVILKTETVIDALDEDRARLEFLNTVVYDTQSDALSFIEENLIIEEVK